MVRAGGRAFHPSHGHQCPIHVVSIECQTSVYKTVRKITQGSSFWHAERANFTIHLLRFADSMTNSKNNLFCKINILERGHCVLCFRTEEPVSKDADSGRKGASAGVGQLLHVSERQETNLYGP